MCPVFLCVLLIYFFMFRNAPKLSFSDWNKYLDEISKTKSIEGNEIRNELINCGKPGFSRATVSLKITNFKSLILCRSAQN